MISKSQDAGQRVSALVFAFLGNGPLQSPIRAQVHEKQIAPAFANDIAIPWPILLPALVTTNSPSIAFDFAIEILDRWVLIVLPKSDILNLRSTSILIALRDVISNRAIEMPGASILIGAAAVGSSGVHPRSRKWIGYLPTRHRPRFRKLPIGLRRMQ